MEIEAWIDETKVYASIKTIRPSGGILDDEKPSAGIL